MMLALLLPFSEFKADLFVWFSSILDHLGTIATGGVLVVMLQLAEKRWPKRFHWPVSWRIFLTFFVFAVFQSWQVEYRSRVGRERDLTESHFQLETTRSALSSDCARKDGAVQSLQQQNRDQQSTINGCLSQAMKLLTPEQRHITALIWDEGDGSIEYLLLTNTPAPMQIQVRCDFDLQNVRIHPVNRLGLMIGTPSPIRSSSRAYNVGYPGVWSPTSPARVQVFYNREQRRDAFTSCSFEYQ